MHNENGDLGSGADLVRKTRTTLSDEGVALAGLHGRLLSWLDNQKAKLAAEEAEEERLAQQQMDSNPSQQKAIPATSKSP